MSVSPKRTSSMLIHPGAWRESLGGSFGVGAHIVSLMRTTTRTAPTQMAVRQTNNATVGRRPDRPNVPIANVASIESTATPARMAATEAVERNT